MSTKFLTMGTVDNDIGGLDNLKFCQFYLSEDIILTYVERSQENSIKDTGVVEVNRGIIRQTILIPSTVPGILRTKDNLGNSVSEYEFSVSEKTGKDIVLISVLFEESNDDFLVFRTRKNEENYSFQFEDREINYNGNTYKVSWKGGGYPKLEYKLMLNQNIKEVKRTARGRRITD
jgi:hypothetical protein